jgi:hypothetical protein
MVCQLADVLEGGHWHDAIRILRCAVGDRNCQAPQPSPSQPRGKLQYRLLGGDLPQQRSYARGEIFAIGWKALGRVEHSVSQQVGRPRVFLGMRRREGVESGYPRFLVGDMAVIVREGLDRRAQGLASGHVDDEMLTGHPRVLPHFRLVADRRRRVEAALDVPERVRLGEGVDDDGLGHRIGRGHAGGQRMSTWSSCIWT